ncbi:hypothetical protein [Hydrogenophaga sp.]|uniref:hypothetical protein n=1 Tax=Hydrogenophaga sp. TaxID=1904254 RepID=UPI0027169228|nr:hypothetical protein [Hydrogenophaga sp.]MDO9434942.1 hypothetical protein [Hydrogenophaga sp.]
MVLRRFLKPLAMPLGIAVCLLALLWVGLRFVHHAPLPTSRVVEFFGGRLALEVPSNWGVGYAGEPPHRLHLAHLRLPVGASLMLDDGLAAPQNNGAAVLRALGIAHPEDLGDGRAAASVARADGRPGAIHHVARVDADGRLLHLQLEVDMARGAEWLPSVAADADFVRGAVRRAALNGDSEIARKEYERWSPSRAALREIEADFQLSYEVLLWALGTFVVVWGVSHLLFEKWLKLGKVGYTWVGQATTLVSLAGLALAGAALVSNRMEHRGKLAESVTVQVASAAVFYMNEQAGLCQRGWSVSIKLHPLLPDSKMVTVDCTRYSETMSRLAEHLALAGTQVVKQGDFVDPKWVMGGPISVYEGGGDRIIAAAGLSDEQSKAVANRYEFFMDPLIQALRVVQKQSDFLASANAFRQLSSLWSICLAGALALGMVKLSGDRRIERSKELLAKSGAGNEASPAPPPAPPVEPLVPAVVSEVPAKVADVGETEKAPPDEPPPALSETEPQGPPAAPKPAS